MNENRIFSQKKIALFVITYNHPDAIREVLALSGNDYFERNIDLYYYEGSESEDSLQVLNEFRTAGFSNIYYNSFPNTTIEDRIQIIINDKELIGQYDYIWLTKDRSFCNGETLDRILNESEKSPDVILIGSLRAGEDIFYDNPSSFYRDWGFLTTSLDVLLYNTTSMLKEVEASNYNFIFGIVTLLFDQLALIDKPKISVLREGVCIESSSKASSMWEKQIFKVWKDDWINANLQLSDVYSEYKSKVIKDAPSLPWILGSTQRLIALHQKGILTNETIQMAEKNWEMISDIPVSVLQAIARGELLSDHSLQRFTTDDAFISLLLKVALMVSEKKAHAYQMPMDDIEMLALNIAENRSDCSKETISLLKGSVKDLCTIIRDNIGEDIVFTNMMQILILMLSH